MTHLIASNKDSESFMEVTPERRNYPRAIAVLPVKVKFQSLGRTLISEGETNDLGIGGISLILRRCPPKILPSAILQLSIPSSGYSVQLDVRVVWLAPTPGNGTYKCGFQFTNISDEQLEALRRIFWPTDEFIEQSIQYLLEIARDKVRQELIVNFFKGDVKRFLLGIIRSYGEIENGQVSEENGQKKINCFFDDIADRGDSLEHTLNDKLLVLEIKKVFRLLTGIWVYQSRIIKLAYEKPRGYPGDHRIIEIIYDNQPITDGAGRYLDKYFLINGYAEAVRQRKEKMIELLHHYILAQPQNPMKILNIGCGPCREIREILQQNKVQVSRLTLTILDQDQEALDFSMQKLKFILPDVTLNSVCADVLRLIKNPEESLSKLGKQHLVYSIGLADYFPDRVLEKLIWLCFKLLYPGGQYILAHKDRDADHHSPLLPDWFCDWKFYPRNEAKLHSLIRGIVPEAHIAVYRDNSRRIIFYKLIRS